MSIGIGDNLGKSFGFAKDSLVGKWLNWLLLIIVTVIPIVNFIGLGTYLKIFRGQKPEVEGIGKSFVDGLLVFIIAIIYMIIPAIVGAILGFLGAVGAIIAAIVGFIFMLLLIPAIIGFAKGGFGAAFAFGSHFAKIGKIGWVQYILAVLVIAVVAAVIGFICGIIPIVGWILGLIVAPFLAIMVSKYCANLAA